MARRTPTSQQARTMGLQQIDAYGGPSRCHACMISSGWCFLYGFETTPVNPAKTQNLELLSPLQFQVKNACEAALS